MSISELLFLAILLIFPNTPSRTCMESRREQIILSAASSSSTYQVPIGLLYSVAFNETHLGCDRGSGGCWGAPIDPQHRHTAGTSDHAALALKHGFERCHTWAGAVSRFRCGLCVCPNRFDNYTDRVMSLSRRLYTRANLAVPHELEGN